MTQMVPTLDEVRTGGKHAMARALAAIEHSGGTAEVSALLDDAHKEPTAFVVGFTGPPGVGKSTLVNALIDLLRKREKTVGVIAVDPSSRVTGGALLGDRTRMTTDPEDDGVFVRSLASRGKLGGLTELAYPAMTLMRAVYDCVIIESVGVGQSEADISTVADTVVLCVQPGSGDSLQFMKAGIMEIPDIAVVTKADFGQKAERAVGELQGALSLTLSVPGKWKVPVRPVSSNTGEGLEELIGEIEEHQDWLVQNGKLNNVRQEQAVHWLESALATRFGSEGLKVSAAFLKEATKQGPFSGKFALEQRISVTFAGN